MSVSFIFYHIHIPRVRNVLFFKLNYVVKKVLSLCKAKLYIFNQYKLNIKSIKKLSKFT
jgi:hypothetical protein